MEDTILYKQKRDQLIEEQNERVRQLREKHARRIEIHQKDWEVIEQLYNAKKQRLKEMVEEEDATYRRKRDALLQEYEEKMQMLEYNILYATEEDSTIALKAAKDERTQHPTNPIVYDDLYDVVHVEYQQSRVSEPAKVLLKGFGDKECVNVVIDDEYDPELIVYKSNHKNVNVVATFEGYTGPNNARKKQWASKHVLLKIICYMVGKITDNVRELIPQLYDGKIVNVHFKHCEPKCQTNKLVYKNNDGECFHVYFATVFNHKEYKQTILQKLEERFPDLTITIHTSGCIMSS